MTLNLQNDDLFRFERAHRAAEQIARLEPHLVALQEVSVRHDLATWLVNRVNEWAYRDEFSAFAWNKIGPQGAFEALTILSRLPVEEPSEAIDLRGGGRIAQRVIVRFEGVRIAFCNVHLHHSKGLQSLRTSQARMVSDWMTELADCIKILAGDFNSVPHSESMSFLFKRWTSAYAKYHEQEPEVTFPTPGVDIMTDWHSPRVIDYILVDTSELDVLGAELCCTQPDVDGDNVYISDHYGLIADLGLCQHIK